MGSEILRVHRTRSDIRHYYDKIARIYDFLADRSERHVREMGLHAFAPRHGETLLEVGFGTGHGLVYLAESVGGGGRVLGVDLSEKMLDVARKRLESKGLMRRCSLWRGDAMDLPLENASVDGVFASFTLELFDTPDLPRALAEWRRVLRPGGRLVVVSLSKEGEEGFGVKLYEWLHRHFPKLLDCRPIYAAAGLASAGFAIESQRISRLWVPLPVEIVLARNGSPIASP